MSSSLFHPITWQWFQQQFGSPTEPQRRGWPAIAAWEHTLIAAPTGSGKTLSAFLVCIDRRGAGTRRLTPDIDDARGVFGLELRQRARLAAKALHLLRVAHPGREKSNDDVLIELGVTRLKEIAALARKYPYDTILASNDVPGLHAIRFACRTTGNQERFSGGAASAAHA